MARILVILDYYLPGFKAGGPVRTIANMVERLGASFEFHVLAADRDLGESKPYPDIDREAWHQVGKAKVMYLPPRTFRLPSWMRLLRRLDYDVLYLNSFFSSTTVRTLLLRRLRLIPRRPVILAPRGEFSPGALALKWPKKRLYMSLARLLCLYEGIRWQASSEYEKADMLSVFPRFLSGMRSSVSVAPNLLVSKPVQIAPDMLSLLPRASRSSTIKSPGSLNAVFLSRISRKKNVDVALRLLSDVSGQVRFDIYGPIEDAQYWAECQALIAKLPPNVTARHLGALAPELVESVLSQYHLFVFPTRGENFGHVIWEALFAGCLLLISDQTPWRNLTERGVGWDLPLSSPDEFRRALEEAVRMDEATFTSRSLAAREMAIEVARDPATAEANRQLFVSAIGGS